MRGSGKGSMGKKHYNARDRAGYSATLECAGMAALNPRASRNGGISSQCKQKVQRSAPLCVGFATGDL